MRTPPAHADTVGIFTTDTYFASGAPWVDPKALGAAGDGQSDDTAYFQKAIGVLPPSGGVINVSPGRYLCGPLVLDERQSIVLRGQGAPTAGAAMTTALVFCGTSGPAFLSARGTYGFRLQGLQILNSGSFAGFLLDLRGATSDSAFWGVEGCYFGGAGVRTATAIALDRAIDGSVRDSTFHDLSVGVQGMTSDGYSNRVLLQGNEFNWVVAAAVMDPGQAWNLSSNTFEGGLGAPALLATTASKPQALSLAGNWFGDVASQHGPAWVVLGAGVSGFTFTGNYVGGLAASTTALLVRANAQRGLHVAGNKFDQHLKAIDFGSTKGHAGTVITANDFAGVTTPVAGRIPPGIIQDGRGLAVLTLKDIGSVWPQGGHDGDVLKGNGRLWVKDGSRWRSVVLK